MSNKESFKEVSNALVVAMSSIESKQKRIDQLEKILREGLEVIEHYDYPDVGMCGNTIIKSGCVANDFLNKPEIIKLMEEE